MIQTLPPPSVAAPPNNTSPSITPYPFTKLTYSAIFFLLVLCYSHFTVHPQGTSFKVTSEAIQIGLVGLISRPILKAVFPSEVRLSHSSESDTDTAEPIGPVTPPSPAVNLVIPQILQTGDHQIPSPETSKTNDQLLTESLYPPIDTENKSLPSVPLIASDRTMDPSQTDLAERTANINIVDDAGNNEGVAGVASTDTASKLELEGENDEKHSKVIPALLGVGAGGAAGAATAALMNGNSDRPSIREAPSRSYIKSASPIVTSYEPHLPDEVPISRRQSLAGSVKAGSVKAGSVNRSKSQTGSVRPIAAGSIRPASAQAGSFRAASVQGSARPATAQAGSYSNVQEGDIPSSQANQPHHMANGAIVGGLAGGAAGLAVGEILSTGRQQDLQRGHSLVDQGPVGRPRSAFGYRPQPVFMETVQERPDSRFAADNRDGMVGRSNTVLSRNNTLGRNGTLSRAANGGTIGSRRGAFGRGAGLSVGTQPEEILGRDDIHTRAELSERALDDETLRRLSMVEKKEAKRLSKMIRAEGKSEAQSVAASIKDLERLARLQKDSIYNERKSQSRLAKWTTLEHKARMRFLKEKEKYEQVEAELRNAENDYEERRDHAAGLTAQVAERTQELDDMRAQKAADDREREVKLLALKNPAHN